MPRRREGHINEISFVDVVGAVSILALTLYTIVRAQLMQEYEKQCPGDHSAAIGETLSILEGSTTMTIHPYRAFGHTKVSFSAVDNGKTIFGSTQYIAEGASQAEGGVHFQDRGTDDQNMTGTLATLTLKDGCVIIATP